MNGSHPGRLVATDHTIRILEALADGADPSGFDIAGLALDLLALITLLEGGTS